MPYKGEIYLDNIKNRTELRKHFRNIRDALKTHGDEVTRELKKVVSTGPRSGRVYFYRGHAYIASAPGEPPAMRSGRLADSFQAKTRVNELLIGSTAFADNGAPYPLFLEEGTSKMRPRPFFVNTIESLNYRLQKDLQELS